MKWKTWRDQLSLGLLFGLPLLWVADGLGAIDLAVDKQVLGATIVVWTLAGQFYFRKKGESGGDG